MKTERQILGHLPTKHISSFIILIVLSSCSTHQVTKDNIFGEWELQSQDSPINYPSISFGKDSIAVLTSRADTIYRYQYRVVDNSIFFKDMTGNESEFKISEVNDSTLIFESLFEHPDRQVYKK